jgi:nucleoporin POM34
VKKCQRHQTHTSSLLLPRLHHQVHGDIPSSTKSRVDNQHPSSAKATSGEQSWASSSWHLRSTSLHCYQHGLSLSRPKLLYTDQVVYEPHRSLSPKELEPYMSYAMQSLRALLLINLLFTLSPLWARKDELEDIPLTPSQRKKLGLGPSSTPATPGSAQYITPPRYSRSTSRSTSSSRAATIGSTYRERSPSGSPINGSPLAGRGVGNTSIWGTGSSPSGSPWVRKAVEGRRLSSGGRLPSGSPLSRELALDESLRVQGTPASGSRASVQLNSKWLYQKRSDSPGSRGLYT